MTRHAKASSAGSIHGRGRLVTFSIAAALLALALFASSAFASKQVISEFGNAAGSGSHGGELFYPRDVAVNETGAGPANAGDTYVAAEGNNRIERFDSKGNFVSAWGKDTIAAGVNEQQRVVLEATAGTYTLTLDGDTTTPIPYTDTEGYALEAALAALPSVGGGANVYVTGHSGSANPFVVLFRGDLGDTDVPTLTADTSQLTGTVAVSTIVNGGAIANDTGTDFEICTVAIECQGGTESGENGALVSPQSVAVDQDTGNVFVSDRGNRRLDEYDGEGNFIRSFGFDVTESGPGDTGTGYEVCSESEGDTCKSGEAGSGVGQYGEGFAENGFDIAVSPADSNASTGTVYLADSGNQRVDTFDLDGANPDTFGSAANFGEMQPRSIAVDSRGIVYASNSDEGGDVQRYDSQNADGGGVGFLAPIPASNNERQEITFTDFSSGDNFKLACPNGTPTEELTYIEGNVGTTIIKNGLEEACGVKVTTKNGAETKTPNTSVSGELPNLTVTFQAELAASNQPQMTCTVLGGGAGSCPVTTIIDGHPGPLLSGSASSATAGLAVNPDGSALYVLRVPDEGPTVVQQFGPAHEPGLTAPPSAADDTHGDAGGLSFSVRGFGVDNARGRFFVSASNGVYVLDDASSLPSPTASTPSVTDIATRSVTFNGEVDPKGGFVSCEFQYSTDETHWTDVSVPACESLNPNGGPQSISESVSGLDPETKLSRLDPDTHYFVRLQITRPFFPDFTPVTSAVQSFATASGPPLISEAKAVAVDDHSVRVSATIDPSRSPTTYVVEYGTSSSLGSSTAPVSVGAGTKPIEVSPVIGGLAPATQYHFKVVATNLVNPAASDNLTTTTFPVPASFGSCPNERFRTGPSAKLPDCRAYEQVTPSDKYGSDVNGTPFGVQASPSGDAITSFTLAGFPGPESFQSISALISRYSNGKWSIAGLSDPYSYGDFDETLAWTSDLRLSFGKPGVTGSPGYGLVMRDNVTGAYTSLIPRGVGFNPVGIERDRLIGGAFDNDSKVLFAANGNVPVTSGPAPVSTEPNVYLYDRDTGELTLAGLLPDSACASPPCVPADGSEFPLASEGYVQDGHVVNSDGDVYFTDRATGQLYLRRDAAGAGAATVPVSVSQKTNGGGPGGIATNAPQPMAFEGATPDGSKAFFTSTEELTNDANTGPEPPLPPTAIGRANIDGSGAQPSFIPTTAKWTAVDSGHVYWTNTEAGTIGRADIGGANPDPSFVTGLENPEGIAVDSGHIYWAEARDHQEGHGTVGRATLAGTSVEKEFITGAGDPHGIAISSEYIYWTNGASTDIGRATITGANPEQSFLERAEYEHPWGIALNATNLYWVDQQQENASLVKTNLSGGGERLTSAGEQARQLAIDSNYLYWGEASNNTIGRHGLAFDGSNSELEFITGTRGVFGVAVDAGHVYWATDASKAPLPPSLGNDLYRYDRESGALIDLAPDSSDPNGAEAIGVLGSSEDGNRVYFAANADLDGAGPAASGDCYPGSVEGGGTCSIYLWQAEGTGGCSIAGGCISFAAHIDASFGGAQNWAGGKASGGTRSMKLARVNSDGSVLVFSTRSQLTTYDSTPTDRACGETGEGPLPCPEFYRYDAESGQISCLTCNPTGAPPVSAPSQKNPDLYHAPSSHVIFSAQPFLSRNLSPNGKRFFFQSTGRLVPTDVNGEVTCSTQEQEVGTGGSCLDVYEWEAPGEGSCTQDGSAYSPANAGCIYLLSTGTGRLSLLSGRRLGIGRHRLHLQPPATGAF